MDLKSIQDEEVEGQDALGGSVPEIIRPSLRAGWFLKWIWTQKGVLFDTILLPLTLLGWLYGLVSRIRVVLYKNGILPQRRVDAFVISIGNITVGGTGKTPLTIYLAREWKKKGCSVGIVSRGYRREDKRSIVLVSDGSRICETVSAVGDEPTLMAERLEGVPIIVSTDRFEGCQWLIQNFKIDVILLDDGFQHLRLQRNMNILIVDASNPFGNRRLLPRGPLREPLSAIQRADLVIFTRVDRGCNFEEVHQEMTRSGRRVLQSIFRSTGLIHLNTGLRYPVSDVKNYPIFCMCGIGNPESFVRSMRVLGAQVKGEIFFGDHHAYKPTDFLEIGRQVSISGAGRVVTTEKDAAKIKPFLPLDLEIWVLQIDVVFLDDPKDCQALLFDMDKVKKNISRS